MASLRVRLTVSEEFVLELVSPVQWKLQATSYCRTIIYQSGLPQNVSKKYKNLCVSFSKSDLNLKPKLNVNPNTKLNWNRKLLLPSKRALEELSKDSFNVDIG